MPLLEPRRAAKLNVSQPAGLWHMRFRPAHVGEAVTFAVSDCLRGLLLQNNTI